jgi:CheY-like chemotaxis protein
MQHAESLQQSNFGRSFSASHVASLVDGAGIRMPRVLLIEDNDANQDLVSRYLALFGCTVTVRRDGLSGLETARRDCSHFDVILMDVNLPEIDGWEVTRRLKADPATRSLPVIALTAHAMKGDREKALAAGCDEYATKPIDFIDLLGKIQSLYNQAPAP